MSAQLHKLNVEWTTSLEPNIHITHILIYNKYKSIEIHTKCCCVLNIRYKIINKSLFLSLYIERYNECKKTTTKFKFTVKENEKFLHE